MRYVAVVASSSPYTITSSNPYPCSGTCVIDTSRLARRTVHPLSYGSMCDASAPTQIVDRAPDVRKGATLDATAREVPQRR